MNESSIATLVTTAVTVAFVHTLIGVDHSMPFVVLGRARGWSLRRVLAVTAACGSAHVVGSIALGGLGIAAGLALDRMELIEGVRGAIASWLIMGFGLAWAAWGFLRARRDAAHGHVHGRQLSVTAFWSLFIIFAFGPCEALIPMLMVPAMEHAWGVVWLVTGAFALVTVATMLGVVSALYVGLEHLRFPSLARWGDVLAGLTITATGAAIALLGI